MIFASHYSTWLIIAATIISYVPACFIMFLLAYRFYLWYRLSKNAITFLFLVGSFFVGNLDIIQNGTTLVGTFYENREGTDKDHFIITKSLKKEK
jgi:uncharacterized membrane protein YfhO